MQNDFIWGEHVDIITKQDPGFAGLTRVIFYINILSLSIFYINIL